MLVKKKTYVSLFLDRTGEPATRHRDSSCLKNKDTSFSWPTTHPKYGVCSCQRALANTISIYLIAKRPTFLAQFGSKYLLSFSYVQTYFRVCIHVKLQIFGSGEPSKIYAIFGITFSIFLWHEIAGQQNRGPIRCRKILKNSYNATFRLFYDWLYCDPNRYLKWPLEINVTFIIFFVTKLVFSHLHNKLIKRCGFLCLQDLEKRNSFETPMDFKFTP